MATRIRRDARSLPTWDPILRWYAEGVKEMQLRAIADPTSWRYQAAVHDYIRANDPYASGADAMPSQAEQKRFWRQCQHFSWFFLPWHRMYLGHFEQMLLAVIINKGGPSDWALPYWNYSSNDADARRLPQAFVEATMPDGSHNPLRTRIGGGGDVVRDEGNDGGLVGDETDVDLASLDEREFEAAPSGGSPGFGGPRTGFKHARRPGEAARFGSLEGTPHGTMHNAVGGWMSGFETAALDPIFWLHHCNIDRLWEVWLRKPGLNPKEFTNPTDPAWTTAIAFDLHDAQGAVVTMNSSQVVKTETSIFAYKYDTVPSALAAPSPAASGMLGVMGTQLPEMVGATQGITLGAESVTVNVPMSAPTGPASVRLASGVAPRVILNVENVTAEGRSKGFALYVNLPPGADPAQHRELFAGNLPLFGIDAIERTDEVHSGEDGLHYPLDITRVVQTLQSRGQWDPQNIKLTFVPKGRSRSAAAGSAPPAVKVGRVSLYFA